LPTYSRTLFGLVVGGVSFAVLLAAGGQVYRAIQDAADANADARSPRERSYSVSVGTLTAETVTPVITAYGILASGRTLELRSSVAGPLVELSENFRDGGAVAAGEVLFRIDPARLETALALAESDLQEAQAELAEARAALELAGLEAGAAETQLTLREQALTRQQGLRERGVATDADVEAAVLARASAEQTLINRRQVVAGDEARVAQSEIAVERRRIALGEAQRALEEATVRAPFAGVMTGTSAVLGRLVSANEKLGELIDPGAMEVAFRVTNTQFGRLINDRGELRKAEITLVAQSGRRTSEIPARIERAGAEVGEGQVGRLVYARLTEPDTNVVRPGDFVTVRIPERPLADVARIPATAATADGRILLIGEGNRLEEVQATLLRQQGDDLIVADVPFGRQYVLARALQLGPGIQVQPVEPRPEGEAGAAAEPAEPETIALDDARRAALVAFIEGNENMKPESKAQVLEALRQPEVPRDIVEKFEAKMAEQ
jgi:multidrug efflux pump subunit AcrA (membrane-fusion protein)